MYYVLDISSKKYTKLLISGNVLSAYREDGDGENYSLKGITELNCSYNDLTSLPPLPKEIVKLYCFYNHLTFLPLLPETLEELSCSYNLLSSLPPLPNTLKRLFCVDNRLISLPPLPNSLHSLYCYDNQLETLPSPPETLVECVCYNNPLSFIVPISKRPKYHFVPKHLQELHSEENYPKYYQLYSTYKYLVTFCALEVLATPTLAFQLSSLLS